MLNYKNIRRFVIIHYFSLSFVYTVCSVLIINYMFCLKYLNGTCILFNISLKPCVCSKSFLTLIIGTFIGGVKNRWKLPSRGKTE